MRDTKRKKSFDCLAYKERVQAEIYEETKGMSYAQLREYFEKRVASGPFADLWTRIPSRFSPAARRSPRKAS